jgi:glycosyltransferase involved in cell wall biosynthesis
VEALAAGNPVIAHDNKYNRWVAGDAALYFSSSADAAAAIERLTSDAALRQELGDQALARWKAEFTWEKVAGEYEALLRKRLEPRKRLFRKLG